MTPTKPTAWELMRTYHCYIWPWCESENCSRWSSRANRCLADIPLMKFVVICRCLTAYATVGQCFPDGKRTLGWNCTSTPGDDIWKQTSGCKGEPIFQSKWRVYLGFLEWQQSLIHSFLSTLSDWDKKKSFQHSTNNSCFTCRWQRGDPFEKIRLAPNSDEDFLIFKIEKDENTWHFQAIRGRKVDWYFGYEHSWSKLRNTSLADIGFRWKEH